MGAFIENAVVILAGGLGTRLRPATGAIPKVLAPVHGRPFLELLLRDLKDNGYRQVVLSLGYGADAVQEYLRSSPWAEPFVRTVREESPLGTGGALLHAIKKVGIRGPVTVANGDTWIDGAWRQLANLAPDSPSIGVVRVSDAGRFGQVTLDASEKTVLRFVERGQIGAPAIIYSGIAVLSPADLEGKKMLTFSLEKDVLTELAAANRLGAFSLEGQFTDIGVPEDYRSFVERQPK